MLPLPAVVISRFSIQTCMYSNLLHPYLDCLLYAPPRYLHHTPVKNTKFAYQKLICTPFHSGCLKVTAAISIRWDVCSMGRFPIKPSGINRTDRILWHSTKLTFFAIFCCQFGFASGAATAKPSFSFGTTPTPAPPAAAAPVASPASKDSNSKADEDKKAAGEAVGLPDDSDGTQNERNPSGILPSHSACFRPPPKLPSYTIAEASHALGVDSG